MNDDLRAIFEASPGLFDQLADAWQRGWAGMRVPPMVRGSQWADEHFELSRSNSYEEQKWKTWPFQRAILDCMCMDGIESVTFRKPARVGYSKMLLAAVGYFAQHKRRNLLIYRPTDGDAVKWVKSDLDLMLRDVPVMAEVFPEFLRRSKANTLEQKCLVDTNIYIQGGKAAKNYRDFTADVVLLDELDGFDRDVEQEGTPTKLSAKRLEGSTWPKHIKGSTPKLRLHSLIDEEHDAAELQFVFHVPCPHCDHEQPLEWGSPTALGGFKWVKDKPETVVHMCTRCGVGFTRAEYLSVWERGRWKTSAGIWIDPECRFIDPSGREMPLPKSVAFSLWTAYSPQATWEGIVKEYLEAHALRKRGDHSQLKTWTNTTRGLSYKLEGAQTSAEVLRERAKLETYRLRLVPRRGLILVAGVDVQDNRLHVLVWAFGRDDESWLIDRRELWGDPGDWKTWVALDTYLTTRYPHEGGNTCAIDSVSIDIGGHFTHQVYRYVMLRESRRVHATHGSTIDHKPIVAGAPSRMDVNVDGQIVKEGVRLWSIGTNAAKDLLFNRLRIGQPGPGYVHISSEVEIEFFDQITSEQRVDVKTSRGIVQRWVKPTSNTRNEDLDCTVMCLFGAHRLKLHQYTDAEWRRLEEALCPPTADLFAAVVPEPLPPPEPLPVAPRNTDPSAAPASPEPVAAQINPAPLWALPRTGRRVRGAVA